MNLTITNRMLPFRTLQRRFKIAFGGRGGTKSQTTIDLLIMAATEGKRICVFREFGSSIEDSVWSLIGDEINRLGVPGFNIQSRKIEHMSGGVFKSKGLGRDSKSVKSFSGFDIFLIEEGDFVTEEILKDLTPTLRKENSELWMIFNPQSREDAISKRFLVPFYDELLKNKVYIDELHYIVWTNYDENPWFPATLEAERKFDDETLPKAEYDHKWLGYFNDTVPNAIIRAEWFDACIDAHIKLNWKPRGVEVVSHDPSDLGDDDKTIVHRHGSLIKNVISIDTGDVNEGCDQALDYAIANNVDLFVWDCDGMGVSLNRQVTTALKGKHIKPIMYKGSHGTDRPLEVYEGFGFDKRKKKTNKETFKNKRAQKSWYLRDRIYNTWLAVTKGIYTDPDDMISFDSTMEELALIRSEFCRIPRKPNGAGLIQLYTKREMRDKFQIASPNRFDGVTMAFEDADELATASNIQFEDWG